MFLHRMYVEIDREGGVNSYDILPHSYKWCVISVEVKIDILIWIVGSELLEKATNA